MHYKNGLTGINKFNENKLKLEFNNLVSLTKILYFRKLIYNSLLLN